jgi:hypothetical protein
MNHVPPNESTQIELAIGDVIVDIEYNAKLNYNSKWHGLTRGKNLRTEQTGLFPLDKVHRPLYTMMYPTYPDAEVKERT